MLSNHVAAKHAAELVADCAPNFDPEDAITIFAMAAGMAARSALPGSIGDFVRFSELVSRAARLGHDLADAKLKRVDL